MPYSFRCLAQRYCTNHISKKWQYQVQYIVDILQYCLLGFALGVTVLESEEDDFKSEFARNSNPKGFKDTKWKSNYIWSNLKAIISTFEEQPQPLIYIFRPAIFCGSSCSCIKRERI